MIPIPKVSPALSLLMVDIDYVKQINDGYGHAAGDAALRKLHGSARLAGDDLMLWAGSEVTNVRCCYLRLIWRRQRSLQRDYETLSLQVLFHSRPSVEA